MTTDTAPPDALAYCADMVRAADSDRYATVPFAPSDRRPGLLALYAFNIEVAKTREVVSQQLLGSIRLQWWRESLEGIYAGTPRNHQVVLPLADAARRHGLDRADFETLIDAREADLTDEPPADLEALAAYTAATAGSLARLALQVLGARDPASLEAGTAVGTAWGLVGLIRAVPFHARMRRTFMPADLLRQAGLSPGAVAERGGSAALSGVVRAVAAAAEERLAAARGLRREVPRRALPGLMAGVLASGYLGQLRRAGWDPFDARIAAPLHSRAWRLLAASLTGRY